MELREMIGRELARRRLRDVSGTGGIGRLSAARALANADVRENADGTYDLIGVEILSTGGPIHGIGSPPEGDFWTLAELREMALADVELGDEILPPNKIGHPDEQALVRNSIAAGELELLTPADGEMPAVGWLEDLRVDGQKLLADVRKVPKVVYELISKGAYRTRSVELSKVTSQRTGKTYDWVVTGLAWLGGKMPAVKTLGDVAALYAGDVPVRRVFVNYAAGDVLWIPKRSLMAIRSELQETLNGPTAMGIIEPRWYVRDVSLDLTAIVEDWTSDGDAFLVSFSVADDGAVSAEPFDQWTPAEPTWIEAARENAAATSEIGFLTLADRRSDTGATMRYSAEQIRKFAEAIGRKPEEVTSKMLEDAGVAPGEEPKPDEETTPAGTKPDEAQPGTNAGGMVDTGTADEPGTEPQGPDKALEARVRGLELELHQAHRRTFVDSAIRSGKIAPGQRETLETLYDRDADAARKFVDELKPREDLLDELGDGDEDRDLEDAGARAYEDQAAARLGIPKDNLV